MQTIIKHIKELLIDGETRKALEHALTDLPSLHSDLVALKASFEQLHRKEQLGTIDSQTAAIQRNRIHVTLLDLLKYPDGTNPDTADGKRTLIDKSLVNEVVQSQHTTMKLYWGFAFLAIFTGIGLFFWFLIFDKELDLLELASSALFTAISAFPIREISSRRDRISVLRVLLLRIDMALQKKLIDRDEINDINEMFKDIMKNLF